MKILVEYSDLDVQSIKIDTAKYLGDYAIRIFLMTAQKDW